MMKWPKEIEGLVYLEESAKILFDNYLITWAYCNGVKLKD